MSHSNLSIAKAYYSAMAKKNIAEMEKYLHPDVEILSPLGKMSGKAVILAGVERLFTIFVTLTIHAKFDSDDQVMLACDYEFSAPIGIVPTAILISFKDDLIIKIQLFYDARPFEKK